MKYLGYWYGHYTTALRKKNPICNVLSKLDPRLMEWNRYDESIFYVVLQYLTNM